MSNLTEYNKLEYNSLRTEIIHHDHTCFNIISLLLGASTAIYGLVVKDNKIFPLLLVLSVIWFVGFLYIVEKRSAIRRISYFIRHQIEPQLLQQKEEKGWEKFSLNGKLQDKKNYETHFPKISTLQIEFSLLVISNIINCYWFWMLQKSFSSLEIGLLIIFIFVIPTLLCGWYVNKYYEARNEE